MDLFNKIKSKMNYNPAWLREGIVVQMSPGYHTKKPYYVEIVLYNPKATEGQLICITNIPDRHQTEMRVGSNWEYHRARMKYIGEKGKYLDLLHNQKIE